MLCYREKFVFQLHYNEIYNHAILSFVKEKGLFLEVLQEWIQMSDSR